MANTKPQKLAIPQLTGIHQSHPEVGKAIQTIMEYINLNVNPVQGNKVTPKR